MTFGIFKKLKDSFKKAKHWIAKALPKARNLIEKAKPIIPALVNIIGSDSVPEQHKNKVKDLLNIVDDGMAAADDLVNRNDSKKAMQSVSKGIDWAKYEIQPRLKKNSSNW